MKRQRFYVTARGRRIYFPSLEAAKAAADDYFRRTRIVLGIEQIRK
jgi:uncharacterized protein YqjF (DUF2071 family)